MIEHTFEGQGSLKLFARSWHPDGAPRSIVILVHGWKSHSGLYEWAAQQLSQAGSAVYGFDLRGHGRSEGERYHVDAFDDYVADLERFVALARSREPELPLFLLGHSAGGVIGSLYALAQPAALAGFICEDISFELPAPDAALAVIKGLSHVAPHAHFLNLKDEDFSRDAEFVAAMKRDPCVNHIPGTVQLLAEIVRADARLREQFSQVSVPLLILHGTADRVAKPHGSQFFYDSAASVDKQLKLYEGHYHDLLNDLGKEQVMADIAAWIGARSPNQP